MYLNRSQVIWLIFSCSVKIFHRFSSFINCSGDLSNCNPSLFSNWPAINQFCCFWERKSYPKVVLWWGLWFLSSFASAFRVLFCTLSFEIVFSCSFRQCPHWDCIHIQLLSVSAFIFSFCYSSSLKDCLGVGHRSDKEYFVVSETTFFLSQQAPKYLSLLALVFLGCRSTESN